MNKINEKAGDAVRRKVLGDDYVNTTLRDWEAAEPILELLEIAPWGFLWRRLGLDLQTRSLITIGILASQDRHTELMIHIRGARRNGCSFEQIIESILHAGLYGGMPAAVEGAKIARAVAREEEEKEKNSSVGGLMASFVKIRSTLSGTCGLALAMGVGRFFFTPVLPLMITTLHWGSGPASWVASGNYLGYFVGSLLCAHGVLKPYGKTYRVSLIPLCCCLQWR